MGVHDLHIRKFTWKNIVSQKQLIFMSLPLVIYLIVFTYVPLWGWTMAFQNYKPGKSFDQQTWVGLKWFEYLFSDEQFLRVLRNTIVTSLINLVLGFVTAIGLALLLNEVKNMFLKRMVQTISYLPHFLSMVIVAGIVMNGLSTEDSLLNDVLVKIGIVQEPVVWLGVGEYFWGIIGGANVWKEVGWNTIIYLAAIASIDPTLYEAASVDGANRYQKMWHITLPGLRPTFVILLILSIGNILNAGFELQFLLKNGLNQDYSQTIDVYVVVFGYQSGNYSMATAAGMFKTIVSVILIFLANGFAKRIGEERLI